MWWHKYSDEKPYDILGYETINHFSDFIDAYSDQGNDCVEVSREHNKVFYATERFLIYYKDKYFIDRMIKEDEWTFDTLRGLDYDSIYWMKIPDINDMSKITTEQKIAFADQILNDLIKNDYMVINTSQGTRPYFADEKELYESDLARKVVKALYDNNISEID